MQYLGGKAKIARQVAAVVNEGRRSPFWEPFAGGLNMTPHLAAGGWGFVSDKHPGLVSLYQYAAANSLPRVVTREDYQAAKTLPYTDPVRAFIEFGCSFGGKSFGGYATNKRGDDFAGQSARAIERDARAVAAAGCVIGCVDFLSDDEPPRPLDLVLYLDPPYRGTTGYGFDFDHDAFVRRALAWSRWCPVFISEYDFPVGEVVWERAKHVGLRSGLNRSDESCSRIERLYKLCPRS